MTFSVQVQGSGLKAMGFKVRDVAAGGIVVQGMLGRAEQDPFDRFTRAGVTSDQVTGVSWKDDRFVVSLSTAPSDVGTKVTLFEGRPCEQLVNFAVGAGGYVAQIGGVRGAGFPTNDRFRILFDSFAAFLGAHPRRAVFSRQPANRLAWSLRRGLWAQPDHLLLGDGTGNDQLLVDGATGEVFAVSRVATSEELNDRGLWRKLGRLPKPPTCERLSWSLERDGDKLAVRVTKMGGHGYRALLEGNRLGKPIPVFPLPPAPTVTRKQPPVRAKAIPATGPNLARFFRFGQVAAKTIS